MSNFTPEELEERRRRLHASEWSAAIGCSPWASPVDVWRDKLGLDPPIEDNQAMEAGRRIEEGIAQWYADETGLTLAPCGTKIHPEHPWIAATPDRICWPQDYPGGPFKILECKNVGLRSAHLWDGPPVHVLVQVIIQMAVTGIHSADIACLIGGNDFRIYPVDWDPDLADGLIEEGRKFWELVVNHVEPPIDASAGFRRHLEEKFPANSAPLAEAPDAAGLIVQELIEARAQIKDATERKQLAESQLKSLIGDRTGIESDRWIATWKKTSSGGIDWKGLAQALEPTEDQIEHHTRAGSRRFLFKERSKK